MKRCDWVSEEQMHHEEGSYEMTSFFLDCQECERINLYHQTNNSNNNNSNNNNSNNNNNNNSNNNSNNNNNNNNNNTNKL